jgi:hypothetical protein
LDFTLLEKKTTLLLARTKRHVKMIKYSSASEAILSSPFVITWQKTPHQVMLVCGFFRAPLSVLVVLIAS